MAKKIILGALVLLMIFSVASAKKSEGVWRLDGNASDELRNFRLMTDDLKNDSRGREPNRQGLENLRASASAQPSLAALKTLYEKIHELEPDAQIFLIDLRQESHGFANALPVSWWIKHNAANAGKTSREVERDEIERLNNLRGMETTFEPLGNSDKQRLKPVTIIPRFMETERTAAEEIGFTYERFAAADMQFPAPEIVDDFIIFVANLPDNAWLHFHCHAGHGRTTTFLVMYDIMKNPDLTLEEICRRQYLLGGTNLLLEPEGDDWNSKMARDRAEKIRLFYGWFQGTLSEEIGLQWSEWLEMQLGMRNFFLICAAVFFLMTSSAKAADAEYLLNNAELYPTLTGDSYCDEIVLETLAQITSDNMSTYDKVLACYNYLVNTCSYGDNVLRLDFPEDNGTARAYGMLAGHVGACDDYSCAFAALTRAIGLNCYTVYGQTARADGGYTGHIWCVIALGGVEYVFDPQIDDNIGADIYYRFCVTYDETPGSYYDSEVRWGYFEPLY